MSFWSIESPFLLAFAGSAGVAFATALFGFGVYKGKKYLEQKQEFDIFSRRILELKTTLAIYRNESLLNVRHEHAASILKTIDAFISLHHQVKQILLNKDQTDWKLKQNNALGYLYTMSTRYPDINLLIQKISSLKSEEHFNEKDFELITQSSEMIIQNIPFTIESINDIQNLHFIVEIDNTIITLVNKINASIKKINEYIKNLNENLANATNKNSLQINASATFYKVVCGVTVAMVQEFGLLELDVDTLYRKNNAVRKELGLLMIPDSTLKEAWFVWKIFRWIARKCS